MSEKKRDIKTIVSNLTAKIVKIKPYTFVIFLVFIGLVYGLLFIQINSLVSRQPTDSDVSVQVKAAKVTTVDEQVVRQLESLKDNSVSVQSLFFTDRTSPF